MVKNPSRTLINWIALGLIVLFIWILLAAIIAPRLRQSASGAGDLDVTATSPSANATTTALFAPTPTAMYWALPEGALITTEDIDQIPAGTRVLVQNVNYTPDGWVYSIATLDRTAAADAREHQLKFASDFDAAAPTPAPRYADSAYWSQCYPLVLLEDVPVDLLQPNAGFIPAGTRVAIGSYVVTPTYVEGHGYQYQYSVTAPVVDDSSAGTAMGPALIGGFAYEYQIAPAEGVTIVEGAPTPISPFEIGVYGAAFITTEDIGSIPSGTHVGIGSAYYSCDHWVYSISTEDGQYTEARQDQLTYDPLFTPGPTPTYPPATATAIIESFAPSDPRFVAMSGLYACSGTENGMLAGAGQLAVAENGYFSYTDYYPGDPIEGNLVWLTDIELDVAENLNILSMTVIDQNNITVSVIEGSLTHTDEGRLSCSRMP